MAWSGLGTTARPSPRRRRHSICPASSRETRLLVEGRYRAIGSAWPRAIEIYRSLFTFFPDNLDYGLLLAGAQTRAGKANEALATIASLRRSFPQSDARVEHYRRLATGGWEYHDATEGVVQLASGVVLDLARLYAQLPD